MTMANIKMNVLITCILEISKLIFRIMAGLCRFVNRGVCAYWGMSRKREGGCLIKSQMS